MSGLPLFERRRPGLQVGPFLLREGRQIPLILILGTIDVVPDLNNRRKEYHLRGV